MPVDAIRTLEKRLDVQHQFLRDHAGREERALETIDKSLGELLAEARAQTQNNVRAADIAEARLEMEREREERRTAAEEAERERQADLTKAELEQRGKVGAWFQAQWEKYGIIAIAALVIAFAPQLLPLLGLAPTQQVTVVQAEPAEVSEPAPEPAEESEP